jgi:hypothetical protein
MAFNINEMRANLQFDGARPSLFDVSINAPIGILPIGNPKFRFMAKATSIPESNMGMIEVPYFGRKIKVAGVRSYTDWQVTIINDEDFLVRRTLEAWHAAINSSEGNIRSVDNYRSTATVRQYGKAGGEAIRSYTMENCWPIQISPIDLAWDNGDAIEEFTVTWAFDYWNVVGPNAAEIVR